MMVMLGPRLRPFILQQTPMGAVMSEKDEVTEYILRLVRLIKSEEAELCLIKKIQMTDFPEEGLAIKRRLEFLAITQTEMFNDEEILEKRKQTIFRLQERLRELGIKAPEPPERVAKFLKK